MMTTKVPRGCCKRTGGGGGGGGGDGDLGHLLRCLVSPSRLPNSLFRRKGKKIRILEMKVLV